ncbi:NEW3 domain-containing protein [Streptomyces sp. NPDC057136]|uniref:NEW3 domain-containing protein n=1 Tax=Streptomyces sp. NPDC057136 TaxID=3346029 RepID=UPI00363B32A5
MVTPGEPAVVRTELADHGATALRDASVRVSAPEGWTVQAAGRTQAVRYPTGVRWPRLGGSPRRPG